MVSSIAQPRGTFNGSNFVLSAYGNGGYESYMEDGARGNVPAPLDRGAGNVSWKRCAYIEFTPDTDESDLFCFFAIAGGGVGNRNAGLLTASTTQWRVEDRQNACQTLQNEIPIEDFKVSIR